MPMKKNVMLQKLAELKELAEELGTIGLDPSGAHEKNKICRREH